MAFTDDQKTQIRRYLGFPDVFRASNTRLESAMDVIGGRSEVQSMIESDLAAITAIEAKLTDSLSSAGIKKVDEIEFFEAGQRKAIREEGRRLCGRLSITMGVPLVADAFGERGYMGDGFMGAGFQYGNGGMFPVG